MLGFSAVRKQEDRVMGKTEAACPPVLVSWPLSVGTRSRGAPAFPQSEGEGAEDGSRPGEGCGAAPQVGWKDCGPVRF